MHVRLNNFNKRKYKHSITWPSHDQRHIWHSVSTIIVWLLCFWCKESDLNIARGRVWNTARCYESPSKFSTLRADSQLFLSFSGSMCPYIAWIILSSWLCHCPQKTYPPPQRQKGAGRIHVSDSCCIMSGCIYTLQYVLQSWWCQDFYLGSLLPLGSWSSGIGAEDIIYR